MFISASNAAATGYISSTALAATYSNGVRQTLDGTICGDTGPITFQSTSVDNTYNWLGIANGVDVNMYGFIYHHSY